MTTVIPFLPTATAPFQFFPVLDGTTYVATISWNVYGQRFYLLLTKQTGEVVCNRGLYGSPPTFDLDLLTSLGFTNTMVYRPGTGAFEIGP